MANIVHGTTFIDPPGIRLVHCTRVGRDEDDGLVSASFTLLGGRLISCPVCRAFAPLVVINDYYEERAAKGFGPQNIFYPEDDQ